MKAEYFVFLTSQPKQFFELTCPFWTQMKQLTSSNDLFGTWKGKRKKGRYFEHIPLKIVITRAVYSPLEDYFAK